MSEELQPADIFLTRGKIWISRAIRFFTRRIGEKRTKVNHVGLVVEGGSIQQAVVVEALSRVRRHRLIDRYRDGKTDVAVYRPLNLTEEEVKVVVSKAEEYVGRKYGYFKIFLHFVDWLLQGAYVFRRLDRMDSYPICSWLVAHAYAKIGKHFGVNPGAATPDDIWDFVTSRSKIYQEVRPLGLLHRREDE
jgi:DNA-binding transcriptional ArsR family regulator